MGVLLMSYFQDNSHERARETIKRANTRHRLEDLGVKKEEVLESLRRLPTFTVEQNHWYSHARLIQPNQLDEDEVLGLLNW
jgi:glycerol dehydrogenase-like iron-containing ADH family enzyme